MQLLYNNTVHCSDPGDLRITKPLATVVTLQLVEEYCEAMWPNIPRMLS